MGGSFGSASTSSVQTPAGTARGRAMGQSTAAPGSRAGTASAKTLPFGRRTRRRAVSSTGVPPESRSRAAAWTVSPGR